MESGHLSEHGKLIFTLLGGSCGHPLSQQSYSHSAIGLKIHDIATNDIDLAKRRLRQGRYALPRPTSQFIVY